MQNQTSSHRLCKCHCSYCFVERQFEKCYVVHCHMIYSDSCLPFPNSSVCTATQAVRVCCIHLERSYRHHLCVIWIRPDGAHVLVCDLKNLTMLLLSFIFVCLKIFL